ncbi:MAG: lipid-binding protein [Saprospiraceae bacterium]|nr:MAG: lipid-binding protein [Saprospiraceae bacterium]
MKSLSLIFALALLGFAFTTPTSETTVYKADLSESVINWKAYKVTGSHTGTVSLKSGNLEYTDGKLSGGSFDMDMAKLMVTDLEGEWKTKLEGHLKSEDFFGVEKYPTAKFVITQVVSRGTPGDYKIVGNLTIKEKTQEIRFLSKVNEEEGKITASGETTIDRSRYDIRYGSGSFFENLGDKTIYDEFELSINLVAKK